VESGDDALLFFLLVGTQSGGRRLKKAKGAEGGQRGQKEESSQRTEPEAFVSYFNIFV
jgi:hypothetical protein